MSSLFFTFRLNYSDLNDEKNTQKFTFDYIAGVSSNIHDVGFNFAIM